MKNIDLDTFLSNEYRYEMFETKNTETGETGYLLRCLELDIDVVDSSIAGLGKKMREAKIEWYHQAQEEGAEIPLPYFASLHSQLNDEND